MEPVSNLLYLLEPAPVALIVTAVTVVILAAHRALLHAREEQKIKDVGGHSDAQTIVLDSQQALMIPVASSVTLLLLFYLFASVSQLITAFTAVAAGSSMIFCLMPLTAHISARVGYVDQGVVRLWCGAFTHTHLALATASALVIITWLITGHWVLNNILGISVCIAFVSIIRLPNIKICALLLVCLFVYDIFWVFFSERLFGANVMVKVATQQASNPIHSIASSLHFPVSRVTKKLDLPVKLLFPRRLFWGPAPGDTDNSYMMLGLGDMAIPGLLLALVLCFDNRRLRDDHGADAGGGGKYFWQATAGYTVGLIVALAAGLLTRSAQPALLYLVPSTLGPVMFAAWSRRELHELWHGPRIMPDKQRQLEV